MTVTAAPEILKAPFPAFGGKSRVADLVWERFGNPRNYIEPFAFSAAVLLRRPTPGAIETINDINAYVANFWRAVQADPEAVTHHADWPINEADLHARHNWLVNSDTAQAALIRVRSDPVYFDAKIAGWWCWGACLWIGSGWCESAGGRLPNQIPDISTSGAMFGRGVHASHKRLNIGTDGSQWGKGVHGSHRRPVIANSGSTFGHGIHADHRPQLADQYARVRGVHSNDSAGTCDQRRAWLTNWMMALADRLRTVRVCCGHWARVCDSESTLARLGTTRVFLDPPYRTKLADGSANRAKHIYASDKEACPNELCDEVQAWSLKWGSQPDIGIAVCGLEGEYPDLDAAGWECVPWKSNGGYGNRNGSNANATRERIWFSPHCHQPMAPGLFAGTG